MFIKGRKVASTSVEVFLSSFCGTEDIITPITPVDEKRRVLSKGLFAQNYGADKNELKQYISAITQCDNFQNFNNEIPRGEYFNHMSLVEIQQKFGEISSDYLIFAIDRNPYRKIISRANMALSFKQYKKMISVWKH